MATNETENKLGRYAAYIDSLITISPKTQATIAKEMGYRNSNNLSLIKSGKIPLPVDKVRPLALSLDADPVRLMLMVLEERHPELLEFFREEGTAPLTKDEKLVLEAFRKRFDNQQGASEKVVEAIKSL
ncbi:XRE family transcriptional regulator [Citrobacter amalonaticus]|uniref:XRE family transcriptional regulator n=1 Tax=Citrobacter amalonaticus TaxID=35703 RepID=A0ABY0HX69_CITAM|nr:MULTISPECIES: XRE family transcriptional regulator [Citrobacter]MZK91461.1 XRE family transcriptional regulator [Citrobacter amalonaticus]MZK96016.1 XRE family transcriptional regulator [Citrobacter amalonaticus]MZL05715.1 XRE family transcriptional regulator [Citrobacter amalonaticus]MZL25786.1 XRE family transcriptional regulator [Citrobacter amalonaticus]MZL43656.1 XRE family transcriptional regulator [Citrobacter amalonaticus]